MSAAVVGQPRTDEPSLLNAVDKIMASYPGYRVEIIGGQILMAPSPEASHALVLTGLVLPFAAAGLHCDETKVVQNVSIWLPDGPGGFATPDLCVVDADIHDHHIERNCYASAAFRLVLEVTSSHWRTDLQTKSDAYADADVPVYVVVDREHERLHVLTDPKDDTYTTHRIHAPGEIVNLPDSIGATVSLDVAEILEAGQSKRTP
ncbi:Uma2 family endonuclease [Streptomyces sp. NPDC002156]